MKQTMEISKDRFLGLTEIISCASIAEKDTLKGIAQIRHNKSYCIVGGMGDGEGGWQALFAYQIVPKLYYDGNPVTYNKHCHEVNEGKRDRGYNGMLVFYQMNELVIVGEEIIIKPRPDLVQTELF